MKLLTNRQREFFNFIEEFIRERPYPPTIREVADNFNVSVKGAYDHIKALERKGYIKAGENRSRSIELVEKWENSGSVVELPLLGEVAAGKPILAEEHFTSRITVPKGLTGTARCFALKVRGDSMINAGILEGDTAIVEIRETAENGEIVVALLEDRATLKRFYKEKGRIKLAAENPNYSPIYSQDVRIIGRLRGIVRNYNEKWKKS